MCLESSNFFSSQQCEGDTLHWSDPLQKGKLWREWFSRSGHCLTHACMLSVRYWMIDVNWIAARMSYPLATLERHWTRASTCSSGMAKVVGCSALSCWELEQATWFLVAGSKRIPGSRHTPTSATKESSSHKISCVWKTPTFSALNNAKRTLFIDLTLCKNGNCGENNSLTAVTAWPMCMCSLCCTGVWCKLDFCTNALISKTGKTLN